MIESEHGLIPREKRAELSTVLERVIKNVKRLCDTKTDAIFVSGKSMIHLEHSYMILNNDVRKKLGWPTRTYGAEFDKPANELLCSCLV